MSSRPRKLWQNTCGAGKVDILADYYGQFTVLAIVENPQNGQKTLIFALLRQKNAIGSLYVTTEK